MSQAEKTRTHVLVVGAGPVGLALAMELGLRGIDTIVIEKQVSRSMQPRAKTLNVRSLEHFRRWGIADEVRAASPLPETLKTDIVFITSVYGTHVTTIENAFFGGDEGDQRFSEPGEWIPQYVVEGVLREKIAALPSVRLIEGTEIVGLLDDGERVEVSAVASDGSERVFVADYVVGADGARSKVRELIGVTMHGQHAYAANYNLVLRIPGLRLDPPTHEGIMYWTLNPDGPSVTGPMDKDIWYMVTQLPPGKTSLSADEVRKVVLCAIGRELDFEILTEDPWFAHQLIATRYSKGRTFLAGDACHLHPPAGGFGMNMGIADGIDLGWKLAARLQGWGGEGLPESYEAERRPVHEWTVREAVENYSTMSNQLLRPGLDEAGPAGDAFRQSVARDIIATKTKEFRTLGIVLGYNYSASPIVVGGDTMPVLPEVESYTPDPRPGCLAPHIWLDRGKSLYDLFGQDFTLLIPGNQDAGADLLRDAALELTIPLTIVEIQDARVEALYGAGLALIRPDQHIAWRGTVSNLAAAMDILRTATGFRLATADQAAAPSFAEREA